MLQSDEGPVLTIKESAAQAGQAIAPLLARIEAASGGIDPVELLCQMSVIHLMHPVNEFPDPDKMGLRQVQLEFLAWLLLSQLAMPAMDRVVGGDVLDALTAALDEYFSTYAVALLSSPDDESWSKAQLSLRHMLQLEAVYVRGDGLPEQVERFAADLYGPHDEWLVANLGFTIDQAVRFTKAVFSLVADKLDAAKQRANAEAEQARVLFLEVLEWNPDTLAPAESEVVERVRSIGPDAVAQQYACAGLFHRLSEKMGFSAAELAAHLGEEGGPTGMERFLDRMSRDVTDTILEPPDPLAFNPLAKTPLIRRGGRYFLPVPPLLYDALLNTLHFDMWRDETYRDIYDRKRAEWLERRALDAFAQLLPGARIHHSLTYGPKGKKKELDGLVLYDNRLILIECKWKKLTVTARQGNVEAAQTDLRQAVAESFEQGCRAREYIRLSKGHATFMDSSRVTVEIDPLAVRETYVVSLLGHGGFSVLAANLPRIAPPEIFQRGEYPWALSINDLETVAEFMETPSQLFDYLKRRAALVADGRFRLHDEWDLLGVYLSGHLSPDDPAYSGYQHITLVGSDSDIDRYLRAREEPALPRRDFPRRSLPATISRLVRQIDECGQAGRSDFLVELLGLPDPTLIAVGRHLDGLTALTSSDRSRHSFSVLSLDGLTGFAAVCTYGDPEGLKRSLVALCMAKKYETRAKVWLGVGLDASESNPLLWIFFKEGEWVPDPGFEKWLPQLKKPGHRTRVPAVPSIAPKLVRGYRTRLASVGRNDLCPCGSGRKYKHCCG